MAKNSLQKIAKELNENLKHINENHYIKIDFVDFPIDCVIILFSMSRESEWPDGFITQTEYIKAIMHNVDLNYNQMDKCSWYDFFSYEVIAHNFNKKEMILRKKHHPKDLMVLYLTQSFNAIVSGDIVVQGDLKNRIFINKHKSDEIN